MGRKIKEEQKVPEGIITGQSAETARGDGDAAEIFVGESRGLYANLHYLSPYLVGYLVCGHSSV